MYLKKFQEEDLSNYSFLVTGGAGFIGSNIVEYLIKYGAKKVRVIDNLCTGYIENIEPYLNEKNFEFLKADITDYSQCKKACEGIDFVLHQAALGSVPRSIENPIETNNSNVTGFLNILNAAKEANIKRFVYASSSSVYGDSLDFPKKEEVIGNPLSPYAVSKYVNELYSEVFQSLYGMEIIGLRYFNIFGPRQNPSGPYAAAIPLFINSSLKNEPVYINGDGGQTRDFTFVENAVQANIKAIFTKNNEAPGKVFNIAIGESVSVNLLFDLVKKYTNSSSQAVHRKAMKGEVRDSLASTEKANKFINYTPETKFEDGLRKTVEWFKSKKW